VDSLLRDLRYGFRVLRQRPVFTIVAVLTLALGIGGNTAIFTVVNASLIRPFPYKDPDRLVHIWETNPQRQQQFNQREASYPDYVDWKAHNDVFEEVAGYAGRNATLSGREGAEQISAARVTANFFPTLGVEAAIGRTFRPGEDNREAEAVVILSDRFYRQRFGASPDALGQTLTVNNTGFLIVGVLPPGFRFARVGDADLWFPLRPSGNQLERRGMHWLNVIARLKPGVSFEQAQAGMNTLASWYEQQDPQSHSAIGLKIVDLREEFLGPVKPVLLVLFGAVGFVLLIACANVAGLLLARSASRRKEIAIRQALGASRARLIRQLLTESVLLSVAGSGLGLLWAGWGVELLIAAIPGPLLVFMPYLQQTSIDGGVLAFTFALTMLTGVAFGLVPAFQSSRVNLQDALKEGVRAAGSVRQRMRSLLVVSEVALALVLLVGAGLMMQSVLRLLNTDPGFDTSNLYTAQISLPAKYSDDSKAISFHREMVSRIEALPGIRGAASVSVLPLTGGGDTGSLWVEGEPETQINLGPEANVRTVSTNYFGVMGIPLTQGRTFTEQDDISSRQVVVVNRSLVDLVLRGENPVGRRIIFGFDSARTPWEIVGIVGDENVVGLDSETTPVVYFSYLQGAGAYFGLVVRTAVDPDSIASTVRREFRSLDPDVTVFGEMSMEQLIANSPYTFVRRFPAMLIATFAIFALILAAIGIHGVISYSVEQRTQEIGIRMALGADRRDILKLVVGQGIALTAAGIGIGLVAALVLTRLMGSLLYGVSATDPLTFVIVSAALTAVSFIASYIPARRATGLDPMVALRCE
ncbi:MAG TPA: ABC transporter permease, partial [Blastocatellia bacterium]|nr:ABC transporter permease [Blastocatellia bacterium]